MTSDQLLQTLAAHRPAFQRFLERKVGSAATAEDLLQEALVRGLTRAPTLANEKAAVGWFYRVLENAALDHFRRTDARARALERLASETDENVDPDESVAHRPCPCVTRLAKDLKPEYAEALARIEVEGVAVKDFAEQAGITRANASVRAHRAREALRRKVRATCGPCADAGCTDCTCVQ